MVGDKPMEPLHATCISTDFGEKCIKVFCSDISYFDESIDILTTSAFMNSYDPTPRTMFRALYDSGISVMELAEAPYIDLRKSCNT